MSQSFGDQLVALLPRLRRFAISLAGSQERGDDLVQTACAKALSAKASYTDGTRFDAWMFRILRNAWIDSIRQQKQEAPATDPADLEEILGEDGERAAVSRLTLQAVMGTIGELPAEQREVLMLVCVEDFSYGEAAEMLNVPIGTVMSRLARAREKISRATGIDPKSNR